MSKLFSHIKLTLLILLISTTVVLGQGAMRGVITDAASSKPLVGANVFIVGTALGGATDLEGIYRIERIPPGRYTLRVTYIGYQTKDTEVQVEYNKTLELNVALIFEVVEGQAIEVTAQFLGQAAAINQQITSKTIINVVSEEKIQELPDANAAESIGRLPGISIQRSGGEANKVVLRGLSDKFSSITINGVRIASTDADARGVDLSTIAQGSLAGIELYKALTPDKDADAIAGSVNLVTKKAPQERLLRLDSRGSYNKLNTAYNQYDFTLRYGERFFNDVLGVQFTGNLEQRDRSKENYDLEYDMTKGIPSGTDYEIDNFTLNYTDELRDRTGFSVLLDLDTPEGGSIRFNSIFNQTRRDYIESERNYPLGPSERLLYSFRDREQEINTLTSAITGENYLFGMTSNWGISFANSRSDFPFDYQMDFEEPSTTDAQGNPLSGMGKIPAEIRKGPLEEITTYALNNFSRAYLYSAFYRGQENNDIEKTAFLNISRQYTLGKSFSGELKIGGKYRDKSRDRTLSELFSPYYIEPFSQYVDSSGVIVRKNFSGTRFENLEQLGNTILLTNYLDSPPVNRALYDKYSLYPLVNRDAIRLWWELNKNGYSDAAGTNPEFERYLEPDVRYYDITERVSAVYLMNTFNFGQAVTLIGGVRAEHENNDYASRYSPDALSGFPVPKGAIRDTSATHQETVWLPNFHLTVRPFNFMNIRFATYKALARPDFNHRLASIATKLASTFFPGNTLYVGNPNLKAAKAWNYEINTSFFHNTIGLFSVSAFYKNVEDMYHLIDELPFKGQQPLDSLGINIKVPFSTSEYALTFPYNSTKPTRIWGLEVEHQSNLKFLPGLLNNIVLSYNFSIIRSETYIPRVRRELRRIPPYPIPQAVYIGEENKQKLEGQPEFFGNFAIGYDIGGFSARLSVFHQGEFYRSFSAEGRGDNLVDAFTRWDLAIKQEITNNIAILLNVNNLTNVEEGTSTLNKLQNWHLLNDSEVYGLTADLGLRITL